MTQKAEPTKADPTQADTTDNTNNLKHPDEWTTGDEPITASQKSYLETVATEASEEVDTETMTKAEASKKIDEMQKKTGRGQ